MKPLLRQFPVLLGLGALLVYSATLSQGITVGNLELAAKVCGWDWRPWVGQPVLWLLTLPLRLLPAAWVPDLLNFSSAACAAATLGLLARSLQLLPWTNPTLAVTGWRQRLPLVFAVVLCGLQLDFWRQATNATGEMLGVLLLAGAVWCLLEFRLNQNIHWLHASVFIWGLGLAENWMMIVTLPAFIIALVALQPLRFLEKTFVFQLAGWGLAGVMIFVILPLANGILPASPLSFKESWITSLQQVRQILGALYFHFFRVHAGLGFVLLAFYLLPLLAWFLCRFEDEPTNQPTLDQLQIFLFRWLRSALLLCCLWLALDPVFGPRSILKNQIHFALPLLSFDYLLALGAGLLAGNLLLAGQRNLPPSIRPIILDHLFFWQECLLLAMVAGGLAVATSLFPARNLAPVQQVNRLPLDQVGQQVVRSLPDGGGIVLSDFADRLTVFRAALAHHSETRAWMAVDVSALSSMDYRAWLQRQHPALGVPSPDHRNLSPAEIRDWIDRLATTHRIFYLHPSFGQLFEAFYLVPSGAAYELRPFVTDTVRPPPLPGGLMEQNEKAWADMLTQIDSLPLTGRPKESSFLKSLRLEPVAFVQGEVLKSWYSLTLNGWGVQLQRAGKLPEARQLFERAIALNPTNLIAQCNLFCNTNLQAGSAMNLAVAARLVNGLANLGTANSLLNRLGPADEPAFCFALGNSYNLARFPRQAMQQFERAAELAPAELAPKFELLSLYTRTRLAGRATGLIKLLHEQMSSVPATDATQLKLALLEADFHRSQNNLATARQILNGLIEIHTDDIAALESVVRAYIVMQDFSNAAAAFDNYLAKSPNHPFLLQAKSELLIQSGQPAAAIPLLNRILEFTNYPPAKFNRAIAYLRVTNYAAAQADFLDLTNAAVDLPTIEYGLAESALGFGETNLAVHYLNRCLVKTPKFSPVWNKVAAKLKELNTGAN
jgi:tetratricopeptide (TPR) repeat protein